MNDKEFRKQLLGIITSFRNTLKPLYNANARVRTSLVQMEEIFIKLEQLLIKKMK